MPKQNQQNQPNKNLHKQPTDEELQAKIDAASEIDENEWEKEEEEIKNKKESDEEPPEADGKENAESDEEEEEPTENEIEEIEEEEEEEKEVNKLKKKFSASSREAQKLHAEKRVIDQAFLEAGDIPEPTEEELQVEFRDWDAMSDTERELARETYISRRFRAKIAEAQKRAEKIEQWEVSVDKFVADPKTLNANPDLEGKTDEFKEFAKTPENNNVPFNLLVGAFLHQYSSTAGKKHKGTMFESGSGGPNLKEKPNSEKISIEDARNLRNTDYEKYKTLLKEGKIDSQDL